MSQLVSGYLTSFPFVHPRQDTPEYKEALAKALSGDGLLPDNSTTTVLHYLYAVANKVSKSEDLVQALNQASSMLLQERKPKSDELVTALKEVATLLPQTGTMIVGAIKEAAEDIALAIKKASSVAGAGGQK